MLLIDACTAVVLSFTALDRLDRSPISPRSILSAVSNSSSAICLPTFMTISVLGPPYPLLSHSHVIRTHPPLVTRIAFPYSTPLPTSLLPLLPIPTLFPIPKHLSPQTPLIPPPPPTPPSPTPTPSSKTSSQYPPRPHFPLSRVLHAGYAGPRLRNR